MPDVYDQVVNQGLQIGAKMMLSELGVTERGDIGYAEKQSQLAGQIAKNILPAMKAAENPMTPEAAIRTVMEMGERLNLPHHESVALLNNVNKSFQNLAKQTGVKQGEVLSIYNKQLTAFGKTPIGQIQKEEVRDISQAKEGLRIAIDQARREGIEATLKAIDKAGDPLGNELYAPLRQFRDVAVAAMEEAVANPEAKIDSLVRKHLLKKLPRGIGAVAPTDVRRTGAASQIVNDYSQIG